MKLLIYTDLSEGNLFDISSINEDEYGECLYVFNKTLSADTIFHIENLPFLANKMVYATHYLYRAIIINTSDAIGKYIIENSGPRINRDFYILNDYRVQCGYTCQYVIERTYEYFEKHNLTI